jgi:hypothetical protein
MQRLATFTARMCSPRGLAVDGDDVGRAIAQRLDPVGEEQLYLAPVDHVIERVVGRKAALVRLVRLETPQEIEPLFAP